MRTIDINCDLGEGYDDKSIMPYISSCNIACGGHIGDSVSVDKTVAIAKENNLAIGAHPSYPDKINFGRQSMSISTEKLRASLRAQIEMVQKSCDKHDVKLNHVKLHGALYNDMAKDFNFSLNILEDIKVQYSDICIYALAGSEAYKAAKTLGMTVLNEVFADRSYTNSTTLRDRKLVGAVLTSFPRIKIQLDCFLRNSVIDHEGQRHHLQADTLCLHSDTPKAVGLAKQIFNYLNAQNVNISSNRK